jgi:hypothetical protein
MKRLSFILNIVLHFVLAIMFMTTCQTSEEHNNKGLDMNNKTKLQLLDIAGNFQKELPVRIRALQDLALIGDSTVINSIKEFLNRAKPGPEQAALNWDPLAAERVIDLHVVETLYKLGDESELSRVGLIVKSAGRILQGPDDELRHATQVILTIGRVEPIQQLIELTVENDLQAVSNADRTLDQLNLPQSPVGSSVSSIAHLSEEHTFEIHALKQEIDTVVRLSQGSISISPGVKAFLASHDYERGLVKRENVTLAEFIEQDLLILDFQYFVQDGVVTICTYKEAGQRWQNWWQKYSEKLSYQKEKSKFIIKT